MRKVIASLVLTAMVFSSSIAWTIGGQVVDINKASNYSSQDYFSKAKELAKKYSEILHLEIIGESRDKKPIYAVVMTENVKDIMKREDFNVHREHYYVEAGNHAREIVNTAIVMKTIEDYCIDYYNNGYIKEFNLKDELKKSVIHFIPLVNPDGHDLVKFGRGAIKTKEALNLLDSIKDKNYPRFKANIAGVDLNRNFPDEYYDLDKKVWVDKFQKYINNYHSYVPSGAFYSGPYGGSEPETQAIMEYSTKYDFRNYLGYHSMGNIIYYDKFWFSKDYNMRALSLAKTISKVNGYRVIEPNNSGSKGSGYFADYVVSQTLKPVITIETTNVQTPTPQKYYQGAYDKNYLLPLYAIKEGRQQGYFKYRLYDKEGNYVRDFKESVYAEALSSRLEGSIIVEGKGVPEVVLRETITRENFLYKIIGNYYGLKSLTVDATDTFKDTKEIVPTFAKNIGLVNGSNGNFRPKDNITNLEVAVLIYNIHRNIGIIEGGYYSEYILEGEYPDWAYEAVKYVVENGYMMEDEFKYNSYDGRNIKNLFNMNMNY